MPQPFKAGVKAVGHRLLSSYPYTDGYLLEHARQIRAAVELPMILLGGIADRPMMDVAMAEGFGFVVMGRALLVELVGHRPRYLYAADASRTPSGVREPGENPGLTRSGEGDGRGTPATAATGGNSGKASRTDRSRVRRPAGPSGALREVSSRIPRQGP